MTENTLRDKVAVVGGGEKNLGGLISRTFAEAGAKVVVRYHSSESDAEQTVKAIQEAGGQAVSVQGDLTKVADVRRLFDTAVDTYGGADLAINTTGTALRKPILKTTFDVLNAGPGTSDRQYQGSPWTADD
jgi:NAD(P)-dependent dehydrogenase (short-subunit alcohol dehydrogenase family)